MRPGGAAGLANLADQVALRQALPCPDSDTGLVKIHGYQALAVIQHDQSALEMHAGFRQADDAPGRRQDGRSLGGRKVRAIVRPLGFAIENPLSAEPTGNPGRLQGHDKACAKIIDVDPAGQSGLFESILLPDEVQQGRVGGADQICGQTVDPLDVEVAGRHGKPMAGGPVRGGDAKVGRQGGVAVEAYDEIASRRSAPDDFVIQGDLGERRGEAKRKSALLKPAGQAQGRRGGEGLAGQGGAAQPKPQPQPQNCAAPVQGLRSRQRIRASAGPA